MSTSDPCLGCLCFVCLHVCAHVCVSACARVCVVYTAIKSHNLYVNFAYLGFLLSSSLVFVLVCSGILFLDAYSVSHFCTPQIFHANTDPAEVVLNRVPQPVLARFVRIRPQTWRNGIALRFELYGCQITGVYVCVCVCVGHSVFLFLRTLPPSMNFSLKFFGSSSHVI